MSLTLLEIKNSIAVITLNRPEKRNALNQALLQELNERLAALEKNADVAAVVLTGGDKAFAAGADIKEMSQKDFADAYQNDFIRPWDEVARFSKPLIAAVSGMALGGGLELAMICDIIYASQTAFFGQPEIQLGIIPGAGGTQRLVKAVGKAKAMEMCLSGMPISAQEAKEIGLVAQIYSVDDYLLKAVELAEKMAKFSLPVLRMVKEAINTSYETHLQEGIHFERRMFHSCFALADQKEGMQAFLEKRPAVFSHR